MCTGFCCRVCPIVSTDNEASVRYGFDAFTPSFVCEGLSYVHYIYISVREGILNGSACLLQREREDHSKCTDEDDLVMLTVVT
jgi:hypothetical protein